MKNETAKIARTIRSIIGPLVIRRSRIDLQQIDTYKEDLKKQKIEVVIPQDPIELTYDLKELKNLYLRTLNFIYGTKSNEEDSDDGVYRFQAARYKPVLYVPEDKREALAKDIERQTGLDDVNMLIGRQGYTDSPASLRSDQYPCSLSSRFVRSVPPRNGTRESRLYDKFFS